MPRRPPRTPRSLGPPRIPREPRVHRIPLALPVTPDRLREIVGQLATELDRGGAQPTLAELDSLAFLCETAHLPSEAARVRRWLGHDEPISTDIIMMNGHEYEESS